MAIAISQILFIPAGTAN